MHRRLRAMAIACVTFAAYGPALVSCDRGKPGKAEKAAAKQARDQQLMALPYPESTGQQPRSMTVSHDEASDRTTITLVLSELRAGGEGAQGITGATLRLSSSHKGRTRPADDPEGTVDGTFHVRTATPGVLAFSGAPATALIDGRSVAMKQPKDKDAYTSAKAAGGEESVRFRFPTEHVVAAANAQSVALKVGRVRIELTAQQLADLKEFAARLKPGTGG